MNYTNYFKSLLNKFKLVLITSPIYSQRLPITQFVASARLGTTVLKYCKLSFSVFRCSLLFCPDCSTLWNFKKRLLAIFKPTNDQSVYDKYLQDLHLTELSLKLHPKSGGAFAHRKWLLSSFFLVQPVSIRQAHVNSFVCSNCKAAKANPVDDRKCFSQKDWNFLINELDFCTRVASWHSCNYMAWSHRVWVISNYVVSCLNGDYIAENDSVQLIQLIQLMFNDKNAVEKWMESHVSDHSCMSYVHFIFVQLNRIELRKCRGCGVGLIQNCFSVSLFSLYTSSLCSNNEILLLHEGQHEALWSHRRALFVLYHKYFNKIGQSVGCDQSIFSMDSELNFCKHFVSSDQFVQRCISRHVKYLKTWVFQ